MRFVWLSWLACGLLLAGSPEQDLNINTRYTIESVELAGDRPDEISTGLRHELGQLVGEKLNLSELDDLARRIRRELHVRSVTHRILKGQQPQHVRVVFDVKGRPAKFDVSVPKLLYNSQAGFTGAAEGTATVGAHAMTFGVVSDGDALLERYAGIYARYEDKKIGSDRVRFRFEFESYHEQWNPGTETALAEDNSVAAGIYRTRMNVEPVATLVLARGGSGTVTMGFGASFENFQTQFPAARNESANAMVTTLRYHRRLEGSNANQQEWDAGYSLRAATNLLGSDYAYARHLGDAHYTYSWGRSAIVDDFEAGYVAGRAPLFERFAAGNSTVLRGWNKFELDPLGGSRIVSNSVEYRYKLLDVFYDSGSIWDQGEAAVFRHSIGIGVRQDSFCIALAFPVRGGHIEPVFMVGMNY